MTQSVKSRFIWIDNIKLFACILVVFGHLYMSLVSGGWISETAVYYCLPIQMIYTFHVPLFFVCSGFLYQKKQVDYSLKSHVQTIKSKAISLGVPYFVFSFVTLFLKIVFTSEVNNQATPILRTLFLEPIAPYWYLYTLFFLFCFIPRFEQTKRLEIAFGITMLVKIVFVMLPGMSVLPDIIVKTAGNAIWFLFGMILTREEIMEKLRCKWMSVVTVALGMILSFVFYRQNNSSSIVQFIIAVLFVYGLVFLFIQFKCEEVEIMISNLSQYFMPVYLMHTIFAAGIRVVLLKIGIDSLFVHVIVGMSASVALPIIVYEIAKKSWMLLFWIEPLKALEIKEKKNV